MPAKTKKKKQSKFVKFISKFDPTNKKGAALLFVVLFAVIGGGYYLYNSYAATSNWAVMLSRYSCPANGYGVPATLKHGSSSNNSNCVRLLQMSLKTYASQAVTVNGTFNTATKTAVINAQRFVGASPTGVADANLWVLMAKLANAAPLPPPPFSAQPITYYCDSAGISASFNTFCNPGAMEILKGGMWYGPYRNMKIPAGGKGIKACYRYQGPTGATTSMYYDIRTTNSGGKVLKSGLKSNFSVNNSSSAWPSVCLNYAAAVGTVLNGVEARVTNNGASAPLYVQNVTLSYY